MNDRFLPKPNHKDGQTYDRLLALVTKEGRERRKQNIKRQEHRKDKRLNTPEFNRKVKKRRIKAKAAKQARKRNWRKK